MWHYFRKAVASPIAITLTAAVVLYLLIPQIIRAREVARNAHCANGLFQHSGWHPSDVVALDGDFNVVGVYSCPLCSDPEYGRTFVIVDDGTFVRYLEDDESVPASTSEDAERRLKIVKQTPRYCELRTSFRRLPKERTAHSMEDKDAH